MVKLSERFSAVGDWKVWQLKSFMGFASYASTLSGTAVSSAAVYLTLSNELLLLLLLYLKL